MALYRVGRVDLDLEIVGVGVRDGALPLSLIAGSEAAEKLSFGETSQETSDLQAFEAAGWRFLPEPDLEWLGVKAANSRAQAVSGLLARHPAGGLVIVRDRLVVKFARGADPASIESRLQRYAETRKLDFGENLFEVQVRTSDHDFGGVIQRELDSLLAEVGGEIAFAEPSLLYHVTQPGDLTKKPSRAAWIAELLAKLDPFPQWQWDMIELAGAWRKGGMGENAHVAVIDLGFHVEDPQIQSGVAWKVSLNQDGEVISTTSLPAHSHGTFCAGLVGARQDGKQVNGAAPSCGLILVAVPPEGVLSQVALAEALRLCAVPTDPGTPGADVITCSLGLSERNWELSDTLREAIDFVHTNGRSKRGTTVVWAVFNADEQIAARSVEAYDDLLCVAQCNKKGKRVDSGYGSGLDFLAPGYGVVGILWEENESRVKRAWGSSFAAPCVAGVAALVLSVNEKLDWRQVVWVLSQGCDPAAKPKTRNDKVGWGRLNARRAVELASQL